MQGWKTHEERQETTGYLFVHVVPVDDDFDHMLVGPNCTCGPKFQEPEESCFIVTHKSMDGREFSEPDFEGYEDEDEWFPFL